MNLPRFEKSRPIVIVPFREEWATEFARIETELRKALGDVAVRIDHIGSTSVPSLSAKDIIDVQVTVQSLDDPRIRQRLVESGYQVKDENTRDVFVGLEGGSEELRKKYAHEREGERRTHIHIREQGRFNQRYALLFRDYLRASPVVAKAYETIKIRLAEIFPESIDGYLYIKDPLMDLIFEAARGWAEGMEWMG